MGQFVGAMSMPKLRGVQAWELAFDPKLSFDDFAAEYGCYSEKLKSGIPCPKHELLMRGTKLCRFSKFQPAQVRWRDFAITPWWFSYDLLMSWWSSLRAGGEGVDSLLRQLRELGHVELELTGTGNDARVLDTVTVMDTAWVFAGFGRYNKWVKQIYVPGLFEPHGWRLAQRLLGRPSVQRLQ